MENSVKALLIAASMILVIMILTLVMVAYNDTSGFFQREHENTVVEQLERFNNQFDNYNDTTIRGNEMLSMINKLIDYNVLQAENDGYDEIELVINGIDSDNVKNQFKSNNSDSSILNNISNKDGQKAISGKIEELLQTARNAGISSITETKLQKLQIEEDTILKTPANDDKKDERNELIKKILGISTDEEIEQLLPTIQSIVKQYHQLVKFKRAYFKCTEIKHSKQTGRVIKMVFEIEIYNSGEVKFD